MIASRKDAPGVGEYVQQTYTYDEGPKHYQTGTPIDAEYRGFAQVKDADRTGDYRLCRYYTTGTDSWTGFPGDPRTGRQYVCYWYESGTTTNPPKTEWTWWNTTSPATGVNFVSPFQTDSYVGTDRHSLWYTYDTTYGNLQVVQDSYPSTSYRKTTTEFNPNTTDWVVNRPSLTTVNKWTGATWAWVQKDAFLYDGATSHSTPPTIGELTSEQRYDDSDVARALRSYLYDDYGNQTRVTTHRNATTSFYTDQTFDSTYHAFRTQETHTTNASPPVTLTTTYTYDFVLGVQKTRTDPNGQVWTTNYDGFGRTTNEISPLDDATYPTIQYAYAWDSTAPNRTLTERRETSGQAGVLQSWEWKDGLDRTVQSGSEAQCDGTLKRDIISHSIYNTVGQAATQSTPYYATITNCTLGTGANDHAGYHTINTSAGETDTLYDAAGRETQVTQPAGGVRTTAYSGFTTAVIDENDHKTETDQDAYGRTATVREYSGECVSGCGSTYALYATTTFGYDVLDRQVSTTDAQSNVSETTYNKLGFATETDDPDRGVWTYDYNDDGTLSSRTDAAGTTTEYTYDSLGRERIREYSGTGITDPDVFHYYDETPDYYPNGTGMPDGYPLGRLTRIVDAAGEQLFSYDERGRGTYDRRLISATQYNMQYTYDAMDRQKTTTYPDGEVVTTAYASPQGLVSSVSSSVSGTLGTTTLANAVGQVTLMQLGNTNLVARSYRSSDYRILGINAATTGGTQLFDQQYRYDDLGNIGSITDNLEQSVSGIDYDHRNRLDDVTIDWPSPTADETFDYDYDVLGNLTEKSESAGGDYPTLTYGAGAPGPHAVTSAQPATGAIRRFEYDENGNQTREYIDNTHPTPDVDVRTFGYNAEGLTDQLVEGATTIDYTYGGDGALTRKDDTVYVGGVYEKDTASGVVTKYYFFAGERIAMREGSTLSFLTTDQLGGTALVTNTSGAMVSRIRYYPFGGIRTQEGTVPATDKLYTGQQQETDDVYHYNARMYNTDIGRMPQADSVVPDGSDPESYNRYAYVVNDPVNLTDPTGHAPLGWLGWTQLDLRITVGSERGTMGVVHLASSMNCGGPLGSRGGLGFSSYSSTLLTASSMLTSLGAREGMRRYTPVTTPFSDTLAYSTAKFHHSATGFITVLTYVYQSPGVGVCPWATFVSVSVEKNASQVRIGVSGSFSTTYCIIAGGTNACEYRGGFARCLSRTSRVFTCDDFG